MGISDRLPGMKPGSRIRNIAVGGIYVFGILMILGALVGGDDPEAGASDPSAEMENAETTITDGGEQTAGDTGSGDSGEGETTTATPTTAATTATDDGGGTESSDGDDSSNDLRVRIITDGQWSGSVGTLEASRSVDGEGKTAIDIDDSADSISASIQKEAQDDSKLTVQILRGDTVVKESSTTAEFGVASVSAMADAQPSSSDSSDSSGQNVEVRVQYEGEWSGSVSAGGQSRSIEGSGTNTIDVSDDARIVSANAQKDDDSSRELTIQILVDGEVVKESSTTAEFGVASVTVNL